MNDLDQLKRQFNTRGVNIEAGQGGLPRVAIATPDAEAHIYLHGAHVTHFQLSGEQDLLFLSTKSRFEAGKAIRGGVPVIFPWFGPKADDPNAPMHGFARTSTWDLTAVRKGTDGSIAVTLEFASSAATKTLWPHDFLLRYTITVGHVLDLNLEVHNTSNAEFRCEEALHTYLGVGDVRQLKINGLAGREFLDKTDGMKRKTQPAGSIVVFAETDRIYLNTTDAVAVTDPVFKRTIVIEKGGSRTTVLWNPWTAKAKAMSDFGDEEWPGMLCVETANAADNSITVEPGHFHPMRARLASTHDEPVRTQSKTKQWEMADF